MPDKITFPPRATLQAFEAADGRFDAGIWTAGTGNPQRTSSDCGDYLVLSATMALPPIVQQFSDWLIRESQAGVDEGTCR